LPQATSGYGSRGARVPVPGRLRRHVAEGRSDARFGLVGLAVGAAGLFAFALGRLTAAVVVDPRRAGGSTPRCARWATRAPARRC